ncbi:hypothetical protein Goari_002385, partial [Gossypium aridum]|nr:hypothetical protein [Gossypium aridum]
APAEEQITSTSSSNRRTENQKRNKEPAPAEEQKTNRGTMNQ